jgi:CTP:molybdopterin cytidylyltransferase MocA
MPDYPFPLMVFAAGFGTRMGALTEARPKPLIPVAGRALIDHALAVAKDAGVRHTVVNTHYRATRWPSIWPAKVSRSAMKPGKSLKPAVG